MAYAEEPLTITVQGEARPAGEIAAEPYVASSRVTRERLAAPAVTAPEVLRSEVGVQIVESGGLGAPATASIRGATAAQTPVYLGGVRLNDQVGGSADLSTIPVWLVDRIDVYRGNGPFAADELGVGGAIFFEPRQPKRTEAAAGATLGSFGTRAGFGYLAWGDARLGVLAGLSAERADNDYPFKDDRGTLFQAGDDAAQKRSNSDSHLRDVWLLARARPSKRARIELLLNQVAREQGVPKLALVPSRLARADLSRGLLALTTRLALGARGRSLLTLRSSLLDSVSQIHDPAGELGTLTRETELRGRRIEQHAFVELPFGESLSLDFATNGSFETLARRDLAQVSDAAVSVLRGATRVSWRPAHPVSVFGLFAGQCRRTAPGPAGCEHFEPTGRVGAALRGKGYAAFFNLSRYQRDPTLGELYGAGILVRGNAALRRELGISAELGGRAVARAQTLSVQVQASAFVRGASDLVAYTRAAQGYVVPSNVGRARVMGLELGVVGRAFEHIELGCNLTLLDPRDTTPGRRLQNDFLPFMSRLVVAPRLRLTTGEREGHVLLRADLETEALYLSNRFADAAGLVVIPDQATLGLSAAATWFSGVLVSRLRLTNATDAERFDIVGYPLPGRSLYGSLELHTP